MKAELMSESTFFKAKPLETGLPILNMAFYGKVKGGLMPGLTIFSGESATFKSMLGLYCIKTFLEENEDGICMFYDIEYGTTPEYLASFGIDTDRVIHLQPLHIEEMKFDMNKRMEALNKGDKVIFFVDSLGAASSKKEIDDALEEKSVADMTRAKAIRSWLRTVSPYVIKLELPMIIINHVYQEIGLYPKTIIPGGTAVTYLANQIFVITKAQLEENKNEEGSKFTIHIHKSRFVKQKKKFPFEVTYNDGIYKWSGLLDIAREAGIVDMPVSGWYTGPNDPEKKLRKADLNGDFWEPILESKEFQDYVERTYRLTALESESIDDRDNNIIESD